MQWNELVAYARAQQLNIEVDTPAMLVPADPFGWERYVHTGEITIMIGDRVYSECCPGDLPRAMRAVWGRIAKEIGL